MRNETIRRAYDSVLPDAEAKERMLRNILSEASNARLEGSMTEMKTRNIKKTIIILAAALAAALSVSAIAYASDLFGFRALLKTDSTARGWSDDNNYQIAISQPQDVDGSMAPEIADKLEKNRRALEEWQGRELVEGSVENVGFESVYDFNYGVRSMEEESMLEEIAAKYGLKLRGSQMKLMWSCELSGMTGEGFYTDAEIVDILSGAGCSGTLFYETPVSIEKAYFYDEGTFGVSWFADLPSSGERYSCYGYSSMYGTLSTGDEVLSFQKEIDSFTERCHTAPDGTELTILSNGSEAYVYVYLENSFFAEHIYPWNCEEGLTDADIDYIADCIDYSVIGRQ